MFNERYFKDREHFNQWYKNVTTMGVRNIIGFIRKYDVYVKSSDYRKPGWYYYVSWIEEEE